MKVLKRFAFLLIGALALSGCTSKTYQVFCPPGFHIPAAESVHHNLFGGILEVDVSGEPTIYIANSSCFWQQNRPAPSSSPTPTPTP